MRLIDANKLKVEDLCDICKSADCSNCFSDNDFEQWLNDQPTAYDIDKVVEQLEKELKLAEEAREIASRENVWRYEQAKGYEVALANAIEIVKGDIDD